jgi:hypothetical protein
MNINIKKLITFLTLEVRNNNVNTIIGYLNSVNDQKGDWQFVVTKLIQLDLAITELLQKELENDISTESLKTYGKTFNNCYSFINEELKLSFINEAPFNNTRVANIQDFNVYILARKTWLKDYN